MTDLINDVDMCFMEGPSGPTAYTIVVERSAKNWEHWEAKAMDSENPARCLGTCQGWTREGAVNNLRRFMEKQFRDTLKEILGKPINVIDYRNL